MTEVISRARIAVTGRELPQEGQEGPRGPVRATEPRDTPPRPQSVTRRPQNVPPPRVLAAFSTAVRISEGVKLSRGAARLWETLHRLAVDVARFRAYAMTPGQVTFHCPAVSVAAATGYTDRHVRSLARELERVGLLDCGGHAQQVGAQNLYDGTLWAVKTRPEVDPPRIRAEAWRHQWRPGFAADYTGKTGAFKEISYLHTQEAESESYYQAAKHRAAIPDGDFLPAVSSPEIIAPTGLNAVADGLCGLVAVHVRHRARRMGQLGSAMCAALGEPERRRYWCRVIWEALRASVEGRAGLQGLSAQVSRLAADLTEGAPWRNAGAVLAQRLKA